MDTADSASTGKDRARTRTGKRTAPRTQRASMADVARLAGVSSQTVSRVSNGYEGVTEETRQQVLAAMNELGYRPNSAARALKRGEFRTIGVITFNLSTTGNMRTLEAIATSAAQEGYAVTLLPVAVPTHDEVRGAFSRLGELAVDAVIVIMEVHLLDAATISLPPHVQVVVADSDAGDRYTVVDTDQAGEPVLLCGTCWTSAIARSGIWPVPRSPCGATPCRCLARRTRRGGLRPAARRTRRLVGGVRLSGRCATRRREGLYGGVRRQRPDGAGASAGLARARPEDSR